MNDVNYVVVILGIVWFYYNDLKRLKNLAPKTMIIFYTTIKALLLAVVLPILTHFFAVNILQVNTSNSLYLPVMMICILSVFFIILLYEEKKAGALDEDIKKIKDEW